MTPVSYKKRKKIKPKYNVKENLKEEVHTKTELMFRANTELLAIQREKETCQKMAKIRSRYFTGK